MDDEDFFDIKAIIGESPRNKFDRGDTVTSIATDTEATKTDDNDN